ncbi:MAG: GNAT family N-acetyltransferase [Candidatus Galacturonibacter soehngenii]|nr:GNAT family N-acetyltransferase [Candidatus Galacturonibacter soehngenii]
MVEYCTFVKEDCIPDCIYTPFIGFVFVEEAYRGNRISQKLINKALNYAKEKGFSSVYICSDENGLYEKYSFKKICKAKDHWGNEEQIFKILI